MIDPPPSVPGSAPPRLLLRVLGSPVLLMGDDALPCGRMGLRVLAVLALNGPQERLRLADLLWDGSSGRALHNLRTTLHTLRRLLGPLRDVLRDDRSRLRLDLTRVHVDVLHPPGTAPELLGYWQDFMDGHHTQGTEQWLDWVASTGSQLLEAHLLQLAELAHTDPDHAAPLLNRARALRGAPGAGAPAALALPDDRPSRPVLVPPSPGRREARALAQAASALLPARTLDLAAQLASQALSAGADGEAAALALNVLATVALEGGQLEEARRLSLAALRRATPPPLEVSYTAAYLHDLLGSTQAARRIARQALRDLRPGESPALMQVLIASTFDAAGQFREARAWHDEALQAAGRLQDAYTFVEVATYTTWHLNATQGVSRAGPLIAHALQVGEAYAELRPYLQCTLGNAYLHAGQLDAAEDTLGSVAAAPTSPRHLIAGARLAVCWLGQGQRDLAARKLRELLPRALGTQLGQARLEWAVAALHLGDPDMLPLADLCARGARGNDPLLVAAFRRLRASFPPPDGRRPARALTLH